MIELTVDRACVKLRPLPARRLLPIAMSIALTLLLGTADAWAKGSALQAGAPPVQASPAETVTRQSEAARSATDGSYAQREAATAGLENFKGGDVVIISSTGVIILLLIILILVLV